MSEAKSSAIAELEAGIRAIDRILALLDDAKIGASFANRKRIVKVAAELSDRRQSAAALVAQMRGADVVVKPVSNDAYAALDSALKTLAEAERNTTTVAKLLKIAGAINKGAKKAREEVSKKTT